MTSDIPPPPRPNPVRRFVAGLVGLGLAALLIWGFLEGRQEAALERERERPVKSPTRVVVKDGERLVTLDEGTQARSGIVVAPLDAATQGQDVRAYGTVVDVKDLADLRRDYEGTRAQAEKAEASLEASKRELDRIQTLHEDDQNVSTKALDAARAAFRSDQASAEAAATALRTLGATLRQSWGPVIGRWLGDGSPSLTRLLERQDVLVQITLPPDAALLPPPEAASLQVREGAATRVSARIVSAAARADPRIQGASFLGIAPATSGLLPGMSVAAFLAAGAPTHGLRVPESAVVLWQGKAWVYVKHGPLTFARREIPTDMPTTGGGYLVRDLPDRAALVVGGAQMLLSEELRAQIEVGEER